MPASRAATMSNVAASASSVALFTEQHGASNRSVQNDSAATLYLKFGATASTTSYTVLVPPGAYYEFPRPAYDGTVHGIWSSATGSARLTEVS